jgi:hypothetical protein
MCSIEGEVCCAVGAVSGESAPGGASWLPLAPGGASSVSFAAVAACARVAAPGAAAVVVSVVPLAPDVPPSPLESNLACFACTCGEHAIHAHRTCHCVFHRLSSV